MPNDIYYMDGRFVAADQAALPLNDLLFLRGYGVFDFLRTYNGKPFYLADHIRRLIHSAEQIGIDVPWRPNEIHDIVCKTLKQNTHPESNIRMVITGGETADNITPSALPRLIVMVTRLKTPPPDWYAHGVKLITVVHERDIPDAKSINYIPAIKALKTAAAQNAVEAIYVNTRGNILEGTTSNIFAFINDTLVTPGDHILSGITRSVVIHIGRNLFQTHIRDISKTALFNADEVFISATNKEIVPVTTIDGHSIGTGALGPRTRKIMEAFSVFTDAYAKTDQDPPLD